MLLSTLPIVFGLMAVTAFAALGARRTGIPESIFLVLLGLAISFLPGMPRIELQPELVLSLFLPPLLYRAGVNMSWRGFRADLRLILALAVGLVIFTAVSVAEVSHYLLGLPLAVGFVLGAVVSPPDAVAPMAIARRFVLPSRVLTVLEGEGLVNDATALILFSFAIAAVTQGKQFSFVEAGGEFFAIVLGEIAWGLFIGWGGLALRRWANDSRVEMVFALLTPFAAFWIPEALGGSGVLATVVCGLFVSWNGPRFISPATRLQGYFVWDLVVYLVGEHGLSADRPSGPRGGRHPGPHGMGAPGNGLRRGLRRHHRGAIHLGLSGRLSAALAFALAGAQANRPRGKAPSSSPSPASGAWCRWRPRCPSRWRRAARPFPIAGWCCWSPSRDPGDPGGAGLHLALGHFLPGHRRIRQEGSRARQAARDQCPAGQHRRGAGAAGHSWKARSWRPKR